MTKLELLQFPTDYPIKVVVRSDAGIRLHIDAIFARHVPDVNLDGASERPSGAGNYLAITYTIRATSAEQVEALVAELAGTPDVMMVI